MNKPLRIIFWGSPDFSAEILRACHEHGDIEVVAVVTQTDKPGGRGHRLIESPVKKIAKDLGIPVLQPSKMKSPDFHEQLSSYQSDLFLVYAYGRILPQAILDIPPRGCFNIHPSLLPKYRGPTPVQSALLDGLPQTGVTLQKMSLGMDEGDIVRTVTIDIDPFETSGTLFQKVGNASRDLTIDTLLDIHVGKETYQTQNNDEATYVSKFAKEDGLIDVNDPVEVSFRKWQAFTPWPSAYFFLEGKRIVVEKCAVYSGQYSGQSGELVELHNEAAILLPEGYERPKHLFGLAHEGGVLVLLQVRPEGKSSMRADSFWHGRQSYS